jgi:trk system potassium uptake protein TrkA
MRIIIIGCGRVGSGLARTLSLRGHAVTVVDRDPSALAQFGASFKGETISGVGFDRDVLLRAGIDRTDGLAAVTGSDEANVVIARLARQVFQVPRVVARLYDPGKAAIYQRLGLPTIAPVEWGIGRLAELLCYSWLDRILSLGNGEVDIVEAEVPSLLVGRTAAELSVPGDIQVAAISRRGKTFLPTQGTVLQTGDLMHLVLLAESADRLKTLLGQP